MGQLLHVIAYVSGLEPDGSDIQTDYVLKKRIQLTAHANALADFGTALIHRRRWKSAYPAELCVAETIVETNLEERPELHKLRKRKEDGEELSLVVVEQIDLCRASPAKDELAAFEEIIWPYLSVIFSAGFSHGSRMSPLERARTPIRARETYQDGRDLMSKICLSNHFLSEESDLDDLQGKLLAHTSDANTMLKKFMENRVR